MRLTAVMAHPDDAEIWSGGTIRKHVERGDEALIVYIVAKEDSVEGGQVWCRYPGGPGVVCWDGRRPGPRHARGMRAGKRHLDTLRSRYSDYPLD